MKRMLCSLCLLFCLFLGCTVSVGEKTPEAPQLEFQSEFTASCGELSFGGSWDSVTPGIYVLALNYPETVAGEVFSCNGETVTLSLDDLSQELPLENFPRSGLPRTVFEIFRACAVNQFMNPPVRDGEYWSFSGECFGKAFVLQTDSTGAVRTITLAQEQIEIRFLANES